VRLSLDDTQAAGEATAQRMTERRHGTSIAIGHGEQAIMHPEPAIVDGLDLVAGSTT
jgi:hypothetical protein